MTFPSDLLADTISAGVAEALRNNADQHTKWRTGQVTAVINETVDSRQVEIHLDGDPAGVTVRMRTLGGVEAGQRALVVFSAGGGVWCLGPFGGVPEELPGGGGSLAMIGEATSSLFMRWYDTAGHAYPTTLEVACTQGVPILFQFTWAADCGRNTGATFLRVHVVNQSTTGDFQPYVIAGDYMTGTGVGSYYERTTIASIIPTANGTVTAQVVPQFELAADPSPASGHGFGSGADDFTIRAFAPVPGAPTGGSIGVPSITRAQFRTTDVMPVSTSGLSGWPGTGPSGSYLDHGWTTITNEDTSRYGIQVGGNNVPWIHKDGVYKVTVEFFYRVQGPPAGFGAQVIDLSEFEVMYEPHQVIYPYPRYSWGTNSANEISGSFSFVVTVEPEIPGVIGRRDYYAVFRMGIFADGATSSTTVSGYSRCDVTFQRLPIIYP